MLTRSSVSIARQCVLVYMSASLKLSSLSFCLFLYYYFKLLNSHKRQPFAIRVIRDRSLFTLTFAVHVDFDSSHHPPLRLFVPGSFAPLQTHTHTHTFTLYFVQATLTVFLFIIHRVQSHLVFPLMIVMRMMMLVNISKSI